MEPSPKVIGSRMSQKMMFSVVMVGLSFFEKLYLVNISQKPKYSYHKIDTFFSFTNCFFPIDPLYK
jgi:hypothetical protein